MRLPAKLNKISETFDGSDDNESDVSFDKTQDDFIQSSNFRVSFNWYFLIASVLINYCNYKSFSTAVNGWIFFLNDPIQSNIFKCIAQNNRICKFNDSYSIPVFKLVVSSLN